MIDQLAIQLTADHPEHTGRWAPGVLLSQLYNQEWYCAAQIYAAPNNKKVVVAKGKGTTPQQAISDCISAYLIYREQAGIP
jgi:hypothetical protein